MEKEQDKLIEHIKFWHGDHTPEHMKEMTGRYEFEGDNDCEVYEAIQKYDAGLIPAERLIAIATDIDDGLMESFEFKQSEEIVV